MSDLISRKATLKHIEKVRQSAQMMDDTHRASILMNGMYLCEKAVRNQPSEQLERKRGKWINGTCNQCGSHAPYWAMATTYYRSNFCPNCGADMWEVDDERPD